MWQAADFADHVASGALSVEFPAKVEWLRTQHTDAVREKSAAESKNHRLTERLATMEAEKGDLRRQLVEERREANKSIADAQAAQVDAKLAQAEGRSRLPTRRGAGGEVQQPVQPRGQSRGLDAHGKKCYKLILY